MVDIYFEHEYGKLYEEIEDGICLIFEFFCEHGAAQHMFIKRPVPWLINDEQYYDIVTPYGYGGPVIVACNTEKEALTAAYMQEFTRYCQEQKIFDNSVYDKLCKIAEVNIGRNLAIGYFPSYINYYEQRGESNSIQSTV